VWHARLRAPRRGRCSKLHGGGLDWAKERQWVKGAKADRDGGTTAADEEASEANHRQDCRCGTQDCVLHGEAGVASLAACSTGAARLG